MFARTSLWSGSSEILDHWAEHVSTIVKPLVASGPGNAGYLFLLDRTNGRGMTVTLWESEDAANASDQMAEQSRASTQQTTGITLVERGRWSVVTSSLRSDFSPASPANRSPPNCVSRRTQPTTTSRPSMAKSTFPVRASFASACLANSSSGPSDIPRCFS